jgi:hypothetical protein
MQEAAGQAAFLFHSKGFANFTQSAVGTVATYYNRLQRVS